MRMQGQHVTHCGRRATSAKGERITMVTSYVPADPLLPDRRRGTTHRKRHMHLDNRNFVAL